jgi:hypothetical protein
LFFFRTPYVLLEGSEAPLDTQTTCVLQVSTEGQPQQSDMQWPALEIRLLEQPEHEERRRVTTLANINNHSDSK